MPTIIEDYVNSQAEKIDKMLELQTNLTHERMFDTPEKDTNIKRIQREINTLKNVLLALFKDAEFEILNKDKTIESLKDDLAETRRTRKDLLDDLGYGGCYNDY